jgi:hypothetical protein
LPAGFDPKTAGSFFTREGTPDDVAKAYLRDRLHAQPTLDIRTELASMSDDFATIRWTIGESGSVLLRRDGASWGVIASTTDGVDLSGIVRDGNRVHGIARNGARQSAFSADVLDLAGKPVPAAPNPQGVPGAQYLYATAARGQAPEMAIDVAVPNEPVLLRVHTVGGTLASVSEVRFNAPAAPQACATTTPPFVFSSLPNGWAVSLNSAWIAGQPTSARQGAKGPGRVESGFDTAVYIEIGLGDSTIPVNTEPFPPVDPPRLDGVAGSVLRIADGYLVTFGNGTPTCPLYVAFHGLDVSAVIAIANGLQRV